MNNILPFTARDKNSKSNNSKISQQSKSVIEMTPSALFEMSFTDKEHVKLREMKRRQYGLTQ